MPAVAPNAAQRTTFLRAPDATAATAPSAQWWEALGDPILDDLVAKALSGSPTLAAAQARITQARANLAATNAAFTPKANVGASAAEVALPGAFTNDKSRLSKQIYAENFDASWELDLFGANRRRSEAARDRMDAAQASAADAAVSLSAEVVRTYAELRVAQAHATLLDKQVDLDRRLLDHATQRFKLGTVGSQDVDEAKSALAQSESDTSDTGAQITVLADQLAVLIGREPGALDDLVAHPAPPLHVPSTVAIGDPARLLRSRPDIRVAERQVAAANADVGAHIADRFPKVTFTGILGLGGTSVGDAFNPGSLVALAMPQIKWNILDGGRTVALKRNARGALVEAEAKYRGTVLDALEDAEASLTRFGSQRIALAKAAESREAAEHLAGLQVQRAQGGTLSRADALKAERQALRAKMAEISAGGTLTSDFVAVEKALGLGWEAQK
ncbi:RND efflux system, outer membrane lipoprotein, NodT [Novosphingobium nitrogenifigens DSM 19370]|uniref:RND efflux system, outer membrane lipoprotein, NodT n=1 Tax=Novosphingobium nitrogenifigens DSM 19370 TaxID=983920 RepID=F1ZAD8_9SPHN|nr:RND efflux system, outer membrane lipoprotein, NodT [Novosphingobium nitrogenifigens DSM 19370]